MNITNYTTKRFLMIDRFTRLAKSTNMNNDILVKMDVEKDHLQAIIEMCKVALVAQHGHDLDGITPEVFDQYDFKIVVTPKTNEITLGDNNLNSVE